MRSTTSCSRFFFYFLFFSSPFSSPSPFYSCYIFPFFLCFACRSLCTPATVWTRHVTCRQQQQRSASNLDANNIILGPACQPFLSFSLPGWCFVSATAVFINASTDKFFVATFHEAGAWKKRVRIEGLITQLPFFLFVLPPTATFNVVRRYCVLVCLFTQEPRRRHLNWARRQRLFLDVGGINWNPTQLKPTPPKRIVTPRKFAFIDDLPKRPAN